MWIILDAIKNTWGAIINWCRHHTQLLAAAAAAFWLVWRELDKQKPTSAERMDAIVKNDGAAVEVKKLAVEQGAAVAHQHVQEAYHETIQHLDAEQQTHAATLLGNPAALAEYLANADVGEKKT